MQLLRCSASPRLFTDPNAAPYSTGTCCPSIHVCPCSTSTPQQGGRWRERERESKKVAGGGNLDERPWAVNSDSPTSLSKRQIITESTPHLSQGHPSLSTHLGSIYRHAPLHPATIVPADTRLPQPPGTSAGRSVQPSGFLWALAGSVVVMWDDRLYGCSN